MRSLKLTKTDEARVHVPALLCPAWRAFRRPCYHTEERVCVLIRRRTDECTKTESGNAGKSLVNSANKLFPEPTFLYLCGDSILSGPLEFFMCSSPSQQVCINSSYLWHALMEIQGVPSFFLSFASVPMATNPK